MKLSLRSPRLWLAVFFMLLLCGVVALIRRETVNPMHADLDKLSAVSLPDRWSHPAMLKIRSLGVKAVPDLRRVLKEKESPTTRLLLWVKAKWPAATKYYSYFPNEEKLTDRLWAASQVLQTLGPAGRAAAPEIIAIMRSNDLRTLNAAWMALQAIGIDADICEQLNSVLEARVPEHARFVIIMALGSVKPPSDRTLKSLATALADKSLNVQQRAIDTIERLGVGNPEIVAALKNLQSNSTDPLVSVSASAALWELEKDSSLVLGSAFGVLEKEINNFSGFSLGGDNRGQGVSQSEQLFAKGGELFQKMPLSEAEKSRALKILEKCCEKSDRIFIRMGLLPSMMELGFSVNDGVEVCRIGLSQSEDYYRIQAARLVASIGEKRPLGNINLEALVHDSDVCVRVYAARAHWIKNREAKTVVPILIEALDRPKHQSYYYAEVLPVALKTLGEIGTEAHDAVRDLQTVLKDPNPAIVKLASEALVKIKN